MIFPLVAIRLGDSFSVGCKVQNRHQASFKGILLVRATLAVGESLPLLNVNPLNSNFWQISQCKSSDGFSDQTPITPLQGILVPPLQHAVNESLTASVAQAVI